MFKTLDEAFKKLQSKGTEVTIVTHKTYGHTVKLTKKDQSVMLNRQKNVLVAINKLAKLII